MVAAMPLHLGHIFPTTDGGDPLCCWLFRGTLFATHFLNLILEVHIDYPVLVKSFLLT